MAEKELLDAIFLDVEMRGLDAYETCRLLKKEPALCNIPVIFISSHDQIEARLRGYEAGADNYIVKPFELQELIVKIASNGVANILVAQLAESSQQGKMTATVRYLQSMLSA